MIAILVKGRGKQRLEWQIKTGAETEEEARATVARMLELDDNGGGWTLDHVDPEPTFEYEREPELEA